MTKREKNKKIINQNLRNKALNRRYTSLIKYLFKTIKFSFLKLKKENSFTTRDLTKLSLLSQKLESVLDKSVNHKVLHRNTASRKKSKLKTFFKKQLLHFYSQNSLIA